MTTFSSVESLYNHISKSKLIDNSNNSLILIGGCSRSGKSTTACELSHLFSKEHVDNVVINLDNWLIDIEKRNENSKVIERYDCNAITESLIKVVRGDKIYPPLYDSHSRKRILEQGNLPIKIKSGVVIAEGVVALALEDILHKAKFKIFVKIDDTLRRNRLELFYRNKGIKMDEIKRIISERENEEVPFTKSTAKHANYILDSLIIRNS